jgi:glycosyltransferase involved in cell wall biosynthesis
VTAPFVTVLTAARNAQRYLPQTIRSILAQTFPDWELIVVDDASEDDTAAVVQGFTDGDPRIRLIRRSSAGGPYVAANEGLSHAAGRYIVRTDADDISTPTRIERQLAFLSAHPDLKACTSWWAVLDADGSVSPRVRRPATASPPVFKWAACVVSGFVHSTACVEAAALHDMGGYAELDASADYGMWCALARRDWLGVVPEVLLNWRRHEQQLSEQRFDLQHRICIDLLGEHLREMTGASWPRDAVEALWAPGRWEPVGLRAGFESLDRWDRAWRSDGALSSEHRRELFRLSARVRARLLKRGHGRDVLGVGRGLLSWTRSWLGGAAQPAVAQRGRE